MLRVLSVDKVLRQELADSDSERLFTLDDLVVR